MKEDDKWVENLRNKLEDYSEPLPDALWERLEEELSAPRVIPMWRTRRFVAAAAVLVVAVSSLTFWFINSPTADYMRSNEALVEELDFSSTPDDEVLSSSEKIFSSDNSKMDSSDPVVASSPAKVCLAKIETPENHNQEVIAESEIMSIKEEDKVASARSFSMICSIKFFDSFTSAESTISFSISLMVMSLPFVYLILFSYPLSYHTRKLL